MQVNTEHTLKNDAMEVFTELLSHEEPTLRAKAARDIMDLRYLSFRFLEAVPSETYRGRPDSS